MHRLTLAIQTKYTCRPGERRRE